jgi:hypothetical protein
LVLAANIGDTLVTVPVVIAGESFVDAVVKVLVVRENDVPADIKELFTGGGGAPIINTWSEGLAAAPKTYESLRSNIC